MCAIQKPYLHGKFFMEDTVFVPTVKWDSNIPTMYRMNYLHPKKCTKVIRDSQMCFCFVLFSNTVGQATFFFAFSPNIYQHFEISSHYNLISINAWPKRLLGKKVILKKIGCNHFYIICFMGKCRTNATKKNWGKFSQFSADGYLSGWERFPCEWYFGFKII